jgi:Leucine-rich repeat (LRR) protein
MTIPQIVAFLLMLDLLQWQAMAAQRDRATIDQIAPVMEQSAFTSPSADTRATLLAFAEETHIGGWKHHDHWRSNSLSICRWYGVCCGAISSCYYQNDRVPNWQTGNFSGSCCKDSGELFGLIMPGNNLVGSIPEVLGNLSSLRVLELSDNRLEGCIPPTLGHLKELLLLQLSANRLSGTIPPELGGLSALQSLLLVANKLEGSLPASVGQWRELYQIQIQVNMLSGTIPDSIYQLTHLVYFTAGYNQLSGSLSPAVGNLQNLTELDLSQNRLDGTIPQTIGELKQLTALSLLRNSFSGSLPSSLGTLKRLTGLYLQGNNLAGTILPAFGGMEDLLALELYSNKLSGTIPPELCISTSLKYLFLYENALSGTLPACLGEMTTLISLGLHQTQIGGKIPEVFGTSWPVMTSLYLSSMLLVGTIPPSLGNLTSLQVLDLQSNALSGSVPAVLGNLESLVSLTLHANQLSGTIPIVLCQISTLADLLLQNNALTGSLPEELGNAIMLSNLNVGSNQLTGTIPVNIFLLPRLRGLYLSHNAFENNFLENDAPRICNSVGILHSIVDLSHNKLSGSLSYFKYFTQASVLLFSHNQFSGPLSITFVSYTLVSSDPQVCVSLASQGQLSTIDVSYNAFTSIGTLPASITSFLASFNNLDGGLNALAPLLNPASIDLHANPSLTGDLPASVWSRPSVRYLFFNDTSIRSARGNNLPAALAFDASVLSSFSTNGGSHEIQCPSLISLVAPDAFISVYPSYFEFFNCSCGVGHYIEGGNCYPCESGRFNDDPRRGNCSSCPAFSYAPQPGAIKCLPCLQGLGIVYDSSQACFNLLPIYYAIAILIPIMAVIVALVVLLVVLGALSSYRLFKWYHAHKLQQATLLIQQRAREEIPADLVIPYQDLKMDVVIGTGSFSRVYRGRWKHTLVAIKELIALEQLVIEQNGVSLQEMLGAPENSSQIQQAVEEFRAEVLVMSHLHHPNVLLLVGACSELPHCCIVTEYLPNGSMYDALHRPGAKSSIPFSRQIQWLLETASGMAYLHDVGLLHRDLKSLNVLLDDSNRAKLCDFGLAKLSAEVHASASSSGGGTSGSMLWMAPEMLMDTAPFSFAADIYSWSIMGWEIMSPEEELYPDISTAALMQAVAIQHKRPTIHLAWPAALCNLFQECWQPNPEARPTFHTIITRLGATYPAASTALFPGGKDESYPTESTTSTYSPLNPLLQH